MATLHLQVVTPEGQIFEGHVEKITLPGAEGEFGVLPQHNPLLTALVPGELTYEKEGKTQAMAVGEGFVEVTRSQVRVLTDLAVGEKEIDEAIIQAALQRAEEALRNKNLIGEELEATQATIARAIAQLKLKRKYRA